MTQTSGQAGTTWVKPNTCEPNKTELYKPDVPGETLKERMDAMVDVVMQSVNLKHVQRPRKKP